MIEINQQAPEFSLPDQDGNVISLKNFQGNSNVVLIMYPGDDTPGCTKQLCAVKDDSEKFAELDTVVLGINHADSESHKKFIKKYGLTVPLLIDEGRKVIEAYGAKKIENGKEGTTRSVIIINKEGIINYIQRGLPSDEELLNKLKEINHK